MYICNVNELFPSYYYKKEKHFCILGAIFCSSDYLDIGTHQTINHQISSHVYLVNSGIKSDVESSDGIWHSSDIYLTPFWQIKDSDLDEY